MERRYVLILLVLFLFITGCVAHSPVREVDGARGVHTAGLNNKDFELAANEAVKSMLDSGVLEPVNGKKNILTISNIINDTMQRIDTDQLVKKIRTALLRSGKVKTTTAIGLHGPEDQMHTVYDQLGKSKKVNKKTLRKQSFTAPNISLTGKIIQRVNRTSGGDELIDYYLQLTLSDLADGLAIWEGETPIQKLASGRTVTW